MNNQLAAGANSGITNPALGSFLSNMVQVPGTSVFFFNKLITALIGLMFIIGSIIFLFMLLWGGIAWISSGGDKQALESARGRITQALIGIIILFSVFVIIKLVETFFGITILTLDIASLMIR